ncbi:MAG: hypothetical protein M3032_13560 [Verrucomicrobiota bacterium]|nr:hypothetical protein [Verrucomicrobiota bacterium]
MSLRAVALTALFLLGFSSARAQEAVGSGLLQQFNAARQASTESAWIDLRQAGPTNSTPQSAPAWIEAVTLVPVSANGDALARTIFRIRVAHRRADLPLLMVRVFFDDKPQQRPTVTGWDESGTLVLRSTELGAGIDLPTSDTVMLPMLGVSCVDVEVPGDGKTIRGVFMDWMASRKVAHPLAAAPRDIVPEPFAATAPLHAPEQDTETFGTVTATLAAETIRIGAAISQGAAFQFPIESRPLVALLTFEVSTARIDSPPEVYVNGENLGPVSLALTDLADPAYQGETQRLIDGMRFRYTGWLRGQKLVPAANLRVGTNDVIVIGGPGTPISAIRATQIQLKYLWEKSDYLLDPK